VQPRMSAAAASVQLSQLRCLKNGTSPCHIVPLAEFKPFRATRNDKYWTTANNSEPVRIALQQEIRTSAQVTKGRPVGFPS
jgi:hypothetical protein